MLVASAAAWRFGSCLLPWPYMRMQQSGACSQIHMHARTPASLPEYQNLRVCLEPSDCSTSRRTVPGWLDVRQINICAVGIRGMHHGMQVYLRAKARP